jgi:hypothetical protein
MEGIGQRIAWGEIYGDSQSHFVRDLDCCHAFSCQRPVWRHARLAWRDSWWPLDAAAATLASSLPAATDIARRNPETWHGHPGGNKRKASVQEACRLFKSYLSAETKFVNSLEENSQACGVPAEAIKQVREGHAKAGQIGKQVCDATARGPRGYEDCNVCGKMGDWGPLVR